LGIEKIILFGSLTSEEIHKSSDIDIMIVRKADKKFLYRIDEFYRYLNPEVAIDILAYTPEEFEEIKESNSFIKSDIRKGRVIYERD